LRRSFSSSSERAVLGRKGRAPSVRTPPRTLRGRTVPVAARTASAGPGIAANFWVWGVDIFLALKGAPRGALAHATRQDPWNHPTGGPRPSELHQLRRSGCSAPSPGHFWFRGSDQRGAGGQRGGGTEAHGPPQQLVPTPARLWCTWCAPAVASRTLRTLQSQI